MPHFRMQWEARKDFNSLMGMKKTYDAYDNRLCESTENRCGVSHLLYNYYSLFIVFYCAIQLFLRQMYLTMLVFTVIFCVSPVSFVYRLFVSGKKGSPQRQVSHSSILGCY